MIALIVDTNILRESPYLSRSDWCSLSAHRADWEISLLVPDVVVMETTKVIPREWAKQQDTLRGAKVGTFGLQENLDALVQGVQEHIDGYETQLRSRLSELGAEVVPCPDVPHMDIALRASRGRAPYHAGDKDGYRDTLIWFTVLDVATKNPDHEVWFVSNNTNDFGDPSVKKKGDDNDDAPQIPRPLHPDLQEDLESRGLQSRVKYATSLRSLEQHIAALHGPISPDHLKDLTSLLDFDALQNLLSDEEVFHPLIAPKDAALDPGTEMAVLSKLITSGHEWTFSDAAGRGEDRWTANYAVDAEAEIVAFSASPPNASSVVNKTLRVSGTAAFTKQGQPEELQISRIEALPDDPNRGVWAVLSAAGFEQFDLVGSANPGFANFIQAFRAAQALTVPPETLQGIKQAVSAATHSLTVPPETLQGISQAVKAAKELTLPPETLQGISQAVKAAKELTLPPETLQGINQAIKAAKEANRAAKHHEELAAGGTSSDSAEPDGSEEPEEGAGGSAS